MMLWYDLPDPDLQKVLHSSQCYQEMFDQLCIIISLYLSRLVPLRSFRGTYKDTHPRTHTGSLQSPINLTYRFFGRWAVGRSKSIWEKPTQACCPRVHFHFSSPALYVFLKYTRNCTDVGSFSSLFVFYCDQGEDQSEVCLLQRGTSDKTQACAWMMHNRQHNILALQWILLKKRNLL